jgi:hypothetical protein
MLGYRVARVWNNAIFENLDGVLQMLSAELAKAPHPNPLPAMLCAVGAVRPQPAVAGTTATKAALIDGRVR